MASRSKQVVGQFMGSFRFWQNHSFRWSEFVLPSTLELSPHLKILLEPVDCQETFFRLELGLHEALVNAVKHGNSEDPHKSLRIRRILTPNWLIWQIQDQGNGLPLSARRGLLPPKLESNRGRGLFLIHKCFDDVRWSHRGNRLQVASRRNQSFNDEDTLDPLSLL